MFRHAKIKTIEELESIVKKAKDEGKTVVFGNGTFDLLHVGHIRYLRGARELGDLLILGVNDDASVRKLKNEGRPVFPLEERLEILSAISEIDYLLPFSQLTVDPVLERLKPDIHAKGTDYTQDTVPERETVKSYGGRIAIVGDPKDHSSSHLAKTVFGAGKENKHGNK